MGRQAWRTTQRVFFKEVFGEAEGAGGNSPSADSNTQREARNHGGPPDWGTPGLVSQSALLWDEVSLHVERVARGRTKISLVR